MPWFIFHTNYSLITKLMDVQSKKKKEKKKTKSKYNRFTRCVCIHLCYTDQGYNFCNVEPTSISILSIATFC